jgi:hypothetical protein
MTAPVESRIAVDSASRASMSFLYGDPATGQTGPDGDVVVEDRSALTVLSLGMRGRSGQAAVQGAVAQLEQWLAGQQTYVAAAAPRLMGYNSPFIPSNQRYWEVQIPVTKRAS